MAAAAAGAGESGGGDQCRPVQPIVGWEVVMYVFSVTFTQLFANTDYGKKHFPSVAESMHTFLMHGNLLDNVSIFMAKTRAESWVASVLFMIFIFIGELTMMNMLVAAVEKEELSVSYVKSSLEGIVQSLDRNGDSLISKDEFALLLEDRRAIQELQEVGVDAEGLVDYADIIFESALGEYDKQLSFPNFMEVVLEFRGSCTATVKDVVNLRKYIRKANQQTEYHVEQANLRLAKMDDMMQKLFRKNTDTGTSSATSKPSFRKSRKSSVLSLLSSSSEVPTHPINVDDVNLSQPETPSPFSPMDAEPRRRRHSLAVPSQVETAVVETDLAAKFEDLQGRMRALMQSAMQSRSHTWVAIE